MSSSSCFCPHGPGLVTGHLALLPFPVAALLSSLPLAIPRLPPQAQLSTRDTEKAWQGLLPKQGGRRCVTSSEDPHQPASGTHTASLEDIHTHTQQGPEGPNCGGRGREVNSSINCAPSVYLITTFTLKLLFEAGSTYSSSQIKKQAHRS